MKYITNTSTSKCLDFLELQRVLRILSGHIVVVMLEVFFIGNLPLELYDVCYSIP